MKDIYKLNQTKPTQKDFIDTTLLSRAEIADIVNTAMIVRRFIKRGGTLNTLYHKNLGMIFEQKSTRTRVSFEVGMEQLGGHALNLAPGAIQLGAHESLSDTARVLSDMCDILMARVDRHESVVELAKKSKVPVLNGMSDYNHPTQEIGDLITILDHKTKDKQIDELKIVFVGDATQVCASLMMITTKAGMNFVHYGPKEKWLSEDYLKLGRSNCESSGGTVKVSDDPDDLKGADFIYTDVWYGLYDKETPKEEYMKVFYPKYQVTKEMMELTGNSEVKFMHCLPASRNEEVTDEVMDGANSRCFEQAENRLTAQRGLLLYYSGKAQEALDEIKKQEKGRVDAN